MRKRIWELYPALTRAVKKTHDATGGRLDCKMFYGHDFDHVLRVADRAMVIAEDETTGRLAAVAGLCHNADRIIQKEKNVGPFDKVDDELVRELVREAVLIWIGAEPYLAFSREDLMLILDAVLNHSNRNSPGDSDVLITLQDADRTVNIEADVIIRCGQYFGDNTRVVDGKHLTNDPNATFQNPGSILKFIHYNLVDFQKEGGVASLRLPKARKIAERRFTFLAEFIDEVIEQRRESGLIPYPTFE